MARRNDHSKEELKALIFETAKKIIKKKGYQALSARKLADEIGYTAGTIYSFYKNIDDLIMHINASSVDAIYDKLAKELNSCSSKKSIETIAKIYVDYSSKNQHLWELLFDYRYKKDFKLPKWYQEKVSRNFDIVAKAIKEDSNTKKDANKLARVLWAGLNGIIVLSSRDKLSTVNSDSVDSLIKVFVENFSRGIKS